jgi:uncharacterized protein with von Willebrand factor type A (vWA) domain
MDATATHDEAVPEAPARRVLGFLRRLREEGFSLGLRESEDALRLVQHGGLADAQRLRWRLRALLCSRAAEWARFDELYEAYWHTSDRAGVRIETSGRVGGFDSAEGPAPEAGGGQAAARRDDAPRRVGASRLASRSDFRLSQLNEDQRPLERWLEALARRMQRRLRRRQRAAADGRRIHLGRTLRRSLRYGGLPLQLVHKRPRREQPRLLVFTDVSRSMNVYSYFFLHFARGLVGAFRRTEVFAFHTSLVPATDTLRERDRHRLKERMAWMAAGWGGGTRIGESLQAFERAHARRALDRRTLVLIVSDGYDAGAPELLGEQMRRLHRRAWRVVWLNPLLGRADYEPSAAGMQAALPHVDHFASVHNLQSLQRIESLLLRP